VNGKDKKWPKVKDQLREIVKVRSVFRTLQSIELSDERGRWLELRTVF
jgi:hypothetical protein